MNAWVQDGKDRGAETDGDSREGRSACLVARARGRRGMPDGVSYEAVGVQTKRHRSPPILISMSPLKSVPTYLYLPLKQTQPPALHTPPQNTWPTPPIPVPMVRHPLPHPQRNLLAPIPRQRPPPPPMPQRLIHHIPALPLVRHPLRPMRLDPHAHHGAGPHHAVPMQHAPHHRAPPGGHRALRRRAHRLHPRGVSERKGQVHPVPVHRGVGRVPRQRARGEVETE